MWMGTRKQWSSRSSSDESRSITSKSAIKMCIKMSKNIYLHKSRPRVNGTAIDRVRWKQRKRECDGLKKKKTISSGKSFSCVHFQSPSRGSRVCTSVTHKLQASRSKETLTNDSSKDTRTRTPSTQTKLQVKPKGQTHTHTLEHKQKYSKVRSRVAAIFSQEPSYKPNKIKFSKTQSS